MDHTMSTTTAHDDKAPRDHNNKTIDDKTTKRQQVTGARKRDKDAEVEEQYQLLRSDHNEAQENYDKNHQILEDEFKREAQALTTKYEVKMAAEADLLKSRKALADESRKKRIEDINIHHRRRFEDLMKVWASEDTRERRASHMIENQALVIFSSQQERHDEADESNSLKANTVKLSDALNDQTSCTPTSPSSSIGLQATMREAVVDTPAELQLSRINLVAQVIDVSGIIPESLESLLQRRISLQATRLQSTELSAIQMQDRSIPVSLPSAQTTYNPDGPEQRLGRNLNLRKPPTIGRSPSTITEISKYSLVAVPDTTHQELPLLISNGLHFLAPDTMRGVSTFKLMEDSTEWKSHWTNKQAFLDKERNIIEIWKSQIAVLDEKLGQRKQTLRELTYIAGEVTSRKKKIQEANLVLENKKQAMDYLDSHLPYHLNQLVSEEYLGPKGLLSHIAPSQVQHALEKLNQVATLNMPGHCWFRRRISGIIRERESKGKLVDLTLILFHFALDPVFIRITKGSGIVNTERSGQEGLRAIVNESAQSGANVLVRRGSKELMSEHLLPGAKPGPPAPTFGNSSYLHPVAQIRPSAEAGEITSRNVTRIPLKNEPQDAMVVYTSVSPKAGAPWPRQKTTALPSRPSQRCPIIASYAKRLLNAEDNATTGPVKRRRLEPKPAGLGGTSSLLFKAPYPTAPARRETWTDGTAFRASTDPRKQARDLESPYLLNRRVGYDQLKKNPSHLNPAIYARSFPLMHSESKSNLHNFSKMNSMSLRQNMKTKLFEPFFSTLTSPEERVSDRCPDLVIDIRRVTYISLEDYMSPVDKKVYRSRSVRMKITDPHGKEADGYCHVTLLGVSVAEQFFITVATENPYCKMTFHDGKGLDAALKRIKASVHGESGYGVFCRRMEHTVHEQGHGVDKKNPFWKMGELDRLWGELSGDEKNFFNEVSKMSGGWCL